MDALAHRIAYFLQNIGEKKQINIINSKESK